MFERYSDQARRTLFFARYEATETGGLTIGTEHLLLGLLRGMNGVSGRILTEAQLTDEAVRERVSSLSRGAEKVAPSVEIPFSKEMHRVLHFAAEEADGLHHRDIGAEHLLLGLLRDEGSTAAAILQQHGLALNRAREAVQRLRQLEPTDRPQRDRVVIEQITGFRNYLGLQLGDPNPRVRELIEQLRRDLDELQRLLE